MITTHKQVGQSLRRQQSVLAQAVVAHRFALPAGPPSRDGVPDHAQGLEDTREQLAFLAQAVQLDRAALFGDYAGWAQVLGLRRGARPGDLAQQLGHLRDALAAQLPAEAAGTTAAVIDLAVQALPQVSPDLPSFLDAQAPLAELAREHLRLLLQGERSTASRRILAAAQAGIPVRQLYIEVFQRTQREVGRLWQLNEISVAQEHYCSAATQMIMSQLYPQVLAGPRTAGTLVATCVAGDLHEIGVRMVADLFEMDGWRTIYLGANTPSAAVVQTLAEQKAQLLVISATLTHHLAAVQDLIERARADARLGAVRILVGGYPFNQEAGLWQQIGADGHARDAEAATALGRAVTATEPP